MPKDILNDLARQAQREQRLGLDAVCVICGEAEYSALTTETRKFLENHHIAGRVHNKGLTVPLCRNCHSKISDGQLSEEVDLKGKEGRTVLHKICAILQGLALFFLMLGDHLNHFAENLGSVILGLDRDYPAWRQMPEVKS